MITVKFSSFLREITKENEILLELEQVSLNELIDLLCHKYGDSFKNKCLEGNTNNLKRFINIFLNKIPLQTRELDSVIIRDNDVIYFLPAISGGGIYL